MSFKGLTVTFSIWLLLLFLFASLGAFMLNWSEYHHLTKSAIETSGTITAKEPENHHFLRYSFLVNGQSYSGLGNAGHGNPEFEQLEIGSRVKVFYDPSNPSKSFLGNPKDQSDSITRGVIFLALGGSVFSIFGLYFKGWLPIRRT